MVYKIVIIENYHLRSFLMAIINQLNPFNYQYYILVTEYYIFESNVKLTACLHEVLNLMRVKLARLCKHITN